MTATSDIEFKTLLEDLEKDPSNLDLINKVAIGYFENYDQKSDKEDYDYFELAYNLKKTVKSTHNFAWFLYFEWSEIEWRWDEDSAIEKALKIQKESIELNPKSYFPYYQYGYMLLDQKKYQEAIPFLEKANKIENQREITHNLGFCHFQLKDYQKAFERFENSVKIQDIENRSLFNLSLAAFQTNRLEQLETIAKKLFAEIETNVHKTVSGYEIGLLFYLLKDYQLATTCLLKQGIDGIDLFDWQELSYSLYLTDEEKWRNKITQSIDERIDWVKEIESGHEDWEDYSEEEKCERLIELKSEIELRNETLSREMPEPKLDLTESLLVEHCGCLLFDCNRHGNRKNDK
tara:strand:- start:9 stop:1052 length:1044 start_codon:yes stop_codon:yes gene_type:complete